MDQFKNLYSKKVIIFSSALLIILAVSLLYSNSLSEAREDYWHGIYTSLLIELISAVIITALISLLLIFLSPKEKELIGVELVDSIRSNAMHTEALQSTDFWYSNVHIGRWIRVFALPKLEKESREKQKNISVKIILIDPTNQEACAAYQRYRNAIDFQDEARDSIDKIISEILATIIVARAFDTRHSGLNVEVYLTDRFHLIREDISSKCVFRTQINPKYPAMVLYNSTDPSSCTFYNSTKTSFELMTKVCKRVPEFPVDLDTLTEDSFDAMLDALGMHPYKGDKAFASLLLSKVKSKYHPYK